MIDEDGHEVIYHKVVRDALTFQEFRLAPVQVTGPDGGITHRVIYRGALDLAHDEPRRPSMTSETEICLGSWLCGVVVMWVCGCWKNAQPLARPANRTHKLQVLRCRGNNLLLSRRRRARRLGASACHYRGPCLKG